MNGRLARSGEVGFEVVTGERQTTVRVRQARREGKEENGELGQGEGRLLLIWGSVGGVVTVVMDGFKVVCWWVDGGQVQDGQNALRNLW